MFIYRYGILTFNIIVIIGKSNELYKMLTVRIVNRLT
jgi:hypothetical protein